MSGREENPRMPAGGIATSPGVEETQAALKRATREYFQKHSCGEVYARGGSLEERLEAQRSARYAFEAYIFEFARFKEGAGRDVLEIGVGMGADHMEWAKAGPRSLAGVDLTPRAIGFTRERLRMHGLSSNLMVTDAEHLPFEDDSFDLVYSWGVLHATPDTPAAVREALRVLRPGGTARVMVYHTHSMVGYMLWLRYALFAGRPWRTLADIYAHHLENPGTKAYTPEEVRRLFSGFSEIRDVRTLLTSSDLLLGEVGLNHKGPVLSLARALWPRWLIRTMFHRHGLWLMIEAVK
jgi:ubiquinone/menaquinone biosynthesis C-methylase UbiE